MEYLLVAKTRLLFKLDGGFNWVGWNGQGELKTTPNGLEIGGSGVATVDDIRTSIAAILTGKKYDGPTFDQPGTALPVSNSGIVIKDESEALAIDGVRVATARTNGEFTINVIPAINTKPKPPVMDPQPSKHGKWKVLDANQNVVESV